MMTHFAAKANSSQDLASLSITGTIPAHQGQSSSLLLLLAQQFMMKNVTFGHQEQLMWTQPNTYLS
jgi:hypothetical protein